MTSLRQTLQGVRERIGRYGRTAHVNEQNTKAALLEPVLRALGWNLEDLDEVQREYRRKRQDKPVDYALFVLRTPRLFVEAKALGENLDDRRWANQIMGYASVMGVQWVVLTDGNEYRIYNSHAAVAVEEKLLRKIRILESDSPSEETLALLSKEQMTENHLEVLWKAHFVDSQVRAAMMGLVSPDPAPALLRLIGKASPSLSAKEIRSSLARARIHLDFPVEMTIAVAAPTPGGARQHGHGKPPSRGTTTRSATGVSVSELVEAGAVRCPLNLEKQYKGHKLAASIDTEGRVRYGGKPFSSLSAAGSEAIASVSGGNREAVDGWKFWRFRDEDGTLKEIDVLRQRYLKALRDLGRG